MRCHFGSRTISIILMATTLFTGCDRDAQYEIESLEGQVSNVWAECDPDVTNSYAATAGISLIPAFRPCGSNNFDASSWSTDGLHLYFQLANSNHVLNGETKGLWEIPESATRPIGPAVWVAPNKFAVPVGPSEEGLSNRLAIAVLPTDSSDAEITHIELELNDPEDLQVDGEDILLTGTSGDGPRLAYRISPSGTMSQAFSWLASPVTSLTYSGTHDLVIFGVAGNNLVVATASTGEVLYRFPNATRGSIDGRGELILMESEGEPISNYRPSYEGELTEQMQRREARRQEEWEANLPDWIPAEVSPPAIDVFDIINQRRVRFVEVHGSQLQWWPGNDGIISLRLWGLEGRELNPNILLSDIVVRYAVIRPGEPLEDNMALVSDSGHPANID